jgi:predicted Zn-dependent peptidase
LRLLKEHEAFLGFPDGSLATPATSHAPSEESGQAISSLTLCLKEQKTEQVVLMLGQPSLSHGHPDDPALRLLQAHLGHGMSSLLFRRLREEHGVAYDVGLHHPSKAEASPFVMHAATSTDRAALTLRLLLESWDEMHSNCLSDEELALARVKVRGQLAHASQTTGQRAERRAQLRGLGLPDDYDQESLQAMERMDGATLQRIANQHLRRPSLSLCGPSSSLKTLESVWEARQH